MTSGFLATRCRFVWPCIYRQSFANRATFSLGRVCGQESSRDGGWNHIAGRRRRINPPLSWPKLARHTTICDSLLVLTIILFKTWTGTVFLAVILARIVWRKISRAWSDRGLRLWRGLGTTSREDRVRYGRRALMVAMTGMRFSICRESSIGTIRPG